MTVDIACHQLTDTGRVNIFGTVKKIRSQRAFSIQTVDQYIFCHTALLEYAEMNGLLRSPVEGVVVPSGSDKEESGATSNRQSQQLLPQAMQTQLLPQGTSLVQQPLPEQPLQEDVLPHQLLSQQPLQEQLLSQQPLPDLLLPHLQQQPMPGLPMPEQPMQQD